MTNRPVALLTFAAVAAVIETMLGAKPAPRFVWNVSESVPTGLYQVQPARDLIVTTLVVAYPPEQLATLLENGGYLPRGVPLIKRILALPGQTVCRAGPTIAVDGIEMGAARERDQRGRVLPVWEGCHTLAGDELFLMNRDEPASLDGRYFGSIPLNAVVGRAVALWTFQGNGSCGRHVSRKALVCSTSDSRDGSCCRPEVFSTIGFGSPAQLILAGHWTRTFARPAPDDRKFLDRPVVVEDATIPLSITLRSWTSRLL